MTKDEAIKLAGNAATLAEVLGITRQAVCQWKDDKIPPLQVYRLKELKPRWFRKPR